MKLKKKILELPEAYTYDDVAIRPADWSTIESRAHVDLSTAMCGPVHLDIPIITSPMDTVTGAKMCVEMHRLGGAGVLNRFYGEKELHNELAHLKMMVTGWSKPRCVSIGVTGNFMEVLNDICHNFFIPEVVVVDVANGAHTKVSDALHILMKYREENHVDFEVVIGNIATYGQAKRLLWLNEQSMHPTLGGYRKGLRPFSGFRVGIANGSACSTFVATKVYVPMVTAISEVRIAIEESGQDFVKIIADGGIRKPGDAAIALAAGADSIMIGSMAAGTDETPGEIIKNGMLVDGKWVKKFRGSASFSSKLDRKDNTRYVEGVETTVPYKGPVEKVINLLTDGLRSAFSYCDARNIQDFRENVQLIRITDNGLKQGNPHILNY